MAGFNQTVPSLSDSGVAGGIVTNFRAAAATLTIAPTGGNSATFSGSIQDGTAQTALTLNGNGVQVLSGVNTFSGPTTITAGTLQTGSNTALSALSAVVIGSSGVLDVDGNAPTAPSLSGNGVVTNNGAGPGTLTLAPAGGSATFSGVIQNGTQPTALTVNGAGTQVLTGANIYGGATTITAGTLQIGSGGTLGSISGAGGIVLGSAGVLAYDRSDTVAVPGNITGNGGVAQIGSGILLFNGNYGYNGPTSIVNGTLAGTGTLDGPVVITAGGTLAPSANVPGSFSTLTVGGLTLATNSQTVLDYDVGSSTGDMVVVQGNLTLGGGQTLDIVGSPGIWPVDLYPLMSYQTITGAPGTLALENVTVGPNDIALVSTAVIGGSKDLVIDVARVDVWTGAQSTAWNTAATNWNTGNGLYADGDAVVFDDTSTTANGAVSQGNVTIAGAVQPALVTVNNSAIPYTFSGPGGIAGPTSLVKNGNGLLTLANAGNTYTGATIINGGTLALGGVAMPAPLMHITFNGPLGAVNNPWIPDSSGNGCNLTLVNPWFSGASTCPARSATACTSAAGRSLTSAARAG